LGQQALEVLDRFGLGGEANEVVVQFCVEEGAVMATIKYLDTASGTYKDIYGFPGATGPAGPTGPAGSGGTGTDEVTIAHTTPTGATGAALELWVSLDEDPPMWVTTGPIGPTGPAGPTGAGATGPTGPLGPTGAGATGPTGPDSLPAGGQDGQFVTRDITYQVAATNLVKNPNMETNILGWYSNSDTQWLVSSDTTAPISGTASLMSVRQSGNLDGTAGSIYGSGDDTGQTPIAPSTTYTIGVTFKAEQASRQARVNIIWYTAAGATISTITGNLLALPTNSPQRYTIQATSPANAAKMYLVFAVFTTSGNSTVGEKCWYDDILIEQGSTAGTYFDGDTEDTETDTYAWTSEPNASTSEHSVKVYSTEWVDGEFLPLSGGQMSGDLILDHDPMSDAEAATKLYVDTKGAGLPAGGGGGDVLTRQETVVDTNMIWNPRFAGSDLTGQNPPQTRWTGNRGTWVADPTLTRNPDGPPSLKITVTVVGSVYSGPGSSAALMSLTDGVKQTVLFSVFPGPGAGVETYRASMYYYDAYGVAMTTTSFVSAPGTDCPEGEWTDIRYVFDPVPGAVLCRCVMGTAQSNLPINTNFWLAEPIMIEGDYQGPYFDGETTDVELDAYGWSGVPNASPATHSLLDADWEQRQIITERSYSVARRTVVAQSFATAVNQAVSWELSDVDDGIPYNSSTNEFTIPVTGYYDVSAAVHFATGTTGYRSVYIYVNGALRNAVQTGASSGGGTSPLFSRTLLLNAGDLVKIQAAQGSGATVLLTTSSGYNWMSITKNPATYPSNAAIYGEQIYSAARFHNAGTSIPNGAFTNIPFDTLAYEDNLVWSGTPNFNFLITVAGYYQVDATLTFATSNTTGVRTTAIFLNAGSVAISAATPVASNVTSSSVATTVKCNVGDYITVRAYQSSGAAVALTTSPGYNKVSVTKVPGPVVPAPAASGTWGSAPLDIYGADSLVGREIYIDSEGRLRVKPEVSELAGGVDLNTITTTGRYTQTATVEAQSGTNYPVPHAGLLEVTTSDVSGGTMTWQRYTVYAASGVTYPGTNVYTRGKYASVWQPWVQIGNFYNGSQICTAATTLATTATTDITGMTLTVPVFRPESVFEVVMTYDVQILVAGTGTFVGSLTVNGVLITQQAVWVPTTAILVGGRVCISQAHRITGLAAAQVVFKGTASNNVAGAMRVNTSHTNMVITQVA
jgi:hypothetical protein